MCIPILNAEFINVKTQFYAITIDRLGFKVALTTYK